MQHNTDPATVSRNVTEGIETARGRGAALIRRGWLRALLFTLCTASGFLLSTVAGMALVAWIAGIGLMELAGSGIPGGAIGQVASPLIVAGCNLLTQIGLVYLFVRYVEGGSLRRVLQAAAAPYPLFGRGLLWGAAAIALFILLLFMGGQATLQTGDATLPGALAALLACALHCLTDELAFRACIQRNLALSLGQMPGVLLGALIYTAFIALPQGIGIPHLLNGFLLALLYSMVYRFRQDIRYPLGLHLAFAVPAAVVFGLDLFGPRFAGIWALHIPGSGVHDGLSDSLWLTAALLIVLAAVYRQTAAQQQPANPPS